MHHLVEFIIRHWLLCGLFLILLITLFYEEGQASGMGLRLSAAKLVQKMNSGDVIIYDIRSLQAYQKGHLVGAVHKLESAFKKNYAFSENKSNSIIVVCEHGNKSGKVAMQFKKAGFTDVAVLSGGVREWLNQKLPLTTGKRK